MILKPGSISLEDSLSSLLSAVLFYRSLYLNEKHWSQSQTNAFFGASFLSLHCHVNQRKLAVRAAAACRREGILVSVLTV